MIDCSGRPAASRRRGTFVWLSVTDVIGASIPDDADVARREQREDAKGFLRARTVLHHRPVDDQKCASIFWMCFFTSSS